MKISELPQDIKELALKYQRDETSDAFSKTTNNLNEAFDWENTKEGYDYWSDLFHKPVQSVFSKLEETNIKPPQYQIGIDTLDRLESNCTIDERLVFARGNIDKYCWRKKGQDKQDFEKIINYANWALKQMENERN